MKKKFSIGVDIGGTHITCAALNVLEENLLEKSFAREAYNHEESAPIILRSWATALNHTLLKLEESELTGIGFAIPGPFDYRNGISKMQHKFKNLYNLHIPTALNPMLIEDKDLPMRFLNDATCFAIGEAWQGAGKGIQKVVVITLGTGFGAAFLDNGIPVVSGGTVPKEGCLWHVPYQNGIADDYFSTRWFVAEYQKMTGKNISGVKGLIQLAEADTSVQNLFTRFGQNLAVCLIPWLELFEAEMLIVGGNIAHALPLFKAGFQEGIHPAGISIPIVTSQLWEKAALLGSARLMDDSFWEKVAVELPTL